MMSARRVVSLIPSATEFVCALECRDRLVGRSHECDFPESVQELPVCTAPKINVGGSSAQIHQEVEAFLSKASKPAGSKATLCVDPPAEGALSIYSVHTEMLKRLKPDLIITQSQCEVCAVSLKDVVRAVSQFVGSQPEIVSLELDTLSDVWQNIARVAEALGVFEQGRTLLEQLRGRVVSISRKARSLKNRPAVACLEWIEPLMACGNWMPELVELAGGVNLFGAAGKHSPWMKWEDLAVKNPDVIVVAPCGFGIERSQADLHFLTHRPEWPKLNAVRRGNVFIVDGNQYFNRPGPRLVESLEILAEILHPGTFHFGHEGKGWERM